MKLYEIVAFFLQKNKVLYEPFAKTNINIAILKYTQNFTFFKFIIILNIFLTKYDRSGKQRLQDVKFYCISNQSL